MSLAAAQREEVYRRLLGRNRVILRLRLIVPVAGTAILVILVGQIYLSSLSSRFGIGQIRISPDSVTIDSPEYSGVLSDGSQYRVLAQSARAAVGHPDLIDMVDGALTINRASGSTMDVNAPSAQLDTTNQLVNIEGIANIEDSSGTTGKLYHSVFDWSAQTLTSKGPVTVDYADGTTILASGLFYDTKAAVWTFSHATVTLPSTPGADAP